jgi:RNA polymerase sigma-70 factor (ECF subfamily)
MAAGAGDARQSAISSLFSRSLYMNAPLAGKDGEVAFTRLCHELRPDLYRFAFWLARDRAVAEDVVQEALLRAWASRDNLTEIGAAKPWLLTIVRREHARLYERKRHDTVSVDELVENESAELAAAADQETTDVRRAIFALEDDYREPLVLQVLMGLSTQDIADQLGLTQAAVLTRLFRARHKLRRALGATADGETE